MRSTHGTGLVRGFRGSDETLPSHLDVANFHKLAQDLVRRAGLAYLGSRNDRYFDDVLPELMMEAIDRLGTQYDAVIVDEGQDFRENWWVPLQCLLHDPDQSIFYARPGPDAGRWLRARLRPLPPRRR